MKLETIVAVLAVAVTFILVALAFVYPSKAAQPPLAPNEQRAKPLECFIPVEVIAVHDGDTIKAELLLPWGITLRDQTVRLLGVDCWEVNKTRQTVPISDAEIEKGKAARDALGKLLMTCPYVYLSPPPENHPKDAYGRLQGRMIVVDPRNNVIDIAEWLKREGHCRTP